MYSSAYERQFSLLLKILPCLKEQETFALKGGTAINLFYRDFPRISVDIDLTYIPIETRDITVTKMNSTMEHLAAVILKRIPGIKVNKTKSIKHGYIVKLVAFDADSIVKIEPNFIFRGCIGGTKKLAIAKKITQEFGYFVDDILVCSFEDVFAGKLCAALNRQHPRDLFDVKLLLENEKISDSLRQALVIYIACDSKPISEMLNPIKIDIQPLYNREFKDMTINSVPIDELINARDILFKTLRTSLTDNERKFLLSVKLGEPDYSLMSFANLQLLPALQWKILNVAKMDKKKKMLMLNNLREVLEI